MEGGQPQEGHHAVFTWFEQFQLHSVIRNGIIPDWFHGIISRKTAEELLLSKPPGYFLIRVSESRIGYTLSYRADDRCRHFMIDALKDGYYVIVGENERHRFLQDLVDFHRRTPIMPFNELLTLPCGQVSKDGADYAELLFPQRQPLNCNNVNIFTHPHNNSQLKPQDDMPPALPHRPTALGASAVPSPNLYTKTPAVTKSQPNTLYPSLEDDLSNSMLEIPAELEAHRPVPSPRKKYLVNPTQPDQLPDLPTRTLLPPLPQKKKMVQACTRPSSAPQTASVSAMLFPTVSNTHSADTQLVRNDDVQLSTAINLMNIRKTFQKKRCVLQEHMSAESRRSTDRGEPTENEYQEIPGEPEVNGPPSSSNRHTIRLSDSGLPEEYLPPPPFAPGYH